MVEIKLSATELVLVSLGLEDREEKLRGIGAYEAANHMRVLRARWDTFCIDADMPDEARLIAEAA